MEIIFAIFRIFKINGYPSLPYSNIDQNSVCVLEQTSGNSISCIIDVKERTETFKIVYKLDNQNITLVFLLRYDDF